MSQLHKIAIGLLGMSHPEIYRFPISFGQAARSADSTAQPTASSKPPPGITALRALKFAIAALLAGARAVPLGDNGRVTQELGKYGAHLRGC
jgi:hypothetical protein